MSVTSWRPQTTMSSQHSPMSVSIQSVPGHCHPAHIPPVHVASMVSDSVWCPRTLHVRAASLSSYSQDIFSSRPTMSGVQGHCMSAPGLTSPGESGHVWRSGPDVQPHPAPRHARCMDRVRHGPDTPGTFPFSQSVCTMLPPNWYHLFALQTLVCKAVQTLQTIPLCTLTHI